MASISDFDNVTPSAPVDLSAIAPPRKSRFPKQGIYTLRVPDTLDPDFTFGTTAAGYRSAEINPTVVGPENEGYEVRFVKLSSKTFEEDVRVDGKPTGLKRPTSQLARFLAACGIQGKLETDEDIKEAVLATAGKEFRAVLDWRAYNKRKGQAGDPDAETTGMENFPKSAAGNPLPWIEDEDDKFIDDATGEEKNRRYSARIFIKRFLNR